MLENYVNEQPVACKILINSINKNEYSHAYILESNGYNKSMGLAIALAKSLFCVNKEEDKEKICKLIDENNFPELKIIDPEGLIIKKEEIDDLQIEFSKKPIYSDKKIYIINNAERLNKSSANSILKFLEEPEQDIIAILITNNIFEMINTIVSRCQIINLKENTNLLSELSYEEKIIYSIGKNKEELINVFGEDDNCLTKCIEFINYYEKYKLDTYVHINNLWFNHYKDKEQFEVAFKIIVLYYIDILKKACHTKIDIFQEHEKQIDEIIKKNSVENICNKINIIINLEKKIKENNNLNLIMDKLLIEFGRGDNIV